MRPRPGSRRRDVALAEAKLRLDRMTVRAPVDGRVYQLVAYPGSTLVGGMGPVPNSDGSTVVTMYRPEMLQIRADVRFEDIPKVSLGQSVMVNNPALAEPIAGQGAVRRLGGEHSEEHARSEGRARRAGGGAQAGDAGGGDVSGAEGGGGGRRMRRNRCGCMCRSSWSQRDEGGAFVWVADQSAGVGAEGGGDDRRRGGGRTGRSDAGAGRGVAGDRAWR